MKQMSENHSHKFSIADKEAVTVLLHKLVTRDGSPSRNVDDRKLLKALNAAARRYSQSKQDVSQAFFHGLLTGYAVGLKHK